MTLEELKMLAAATLLSGSVKQLVFTMGTPTKDEISQAVIVAEQIWEEVCKEESR
jgi:hypothetical protein